jgi:hypothetical protein
MALTFGLLMPRMAPADEKRSGDQVIIVTNTDDDSAACHVRLHESSARCTNESCVIPAPRGSSLKTVQVLFSCLPTSARTGFEDPPPDAIVFSVKTLNKNAEVSVIDDPASESGERMRHLSFCLFGKNATFCGYARTLRLRDGDPGDASEEVIKLIKEITFLDNASQN